MNSLPNKAIVLKSQKRSYFIRNKLITKFYLCVLSIYSSFRIRKEHSYARTSTGLPRPINPKYTNASFPCSNCPYVAKRKGTLDDHEKFHCPNKISPVKKEAICFVENISHIMDCVII